MDSKIEVLKNLAIYDRIRAAGENMVTSQNKMAPLVLKMCDVGDEVCRSYLSLYKYIDENPNEFGSPAIKRKYEKEILPLEEKRDSLTRLLKEQCAEVLFV